MNFLKERDKIESLVRKIDRLGYKWGACSLGDLLLVLVTEDEIHLNYRDDVESGEKTPSIIIKSGHKTGDYPVTVLHAEMYSVDEVDGYVEITEPTSISPCKTLKEIFMGIAEYIYQ